MKSNNKTNKDKTPHLFSIACFSTDLKDYSPITIIKKYLHLEQCSNVKCGKEEIEFDHSSNAASGRMTRCKLYEISNISQKNSKCDFVDSYIIFINLEGNEVYNQMDSFISYINNFGKKELKIYLIGLYKNIDNVGELNKKKEIKKMIAVAGADNLTSLQTCRKCKDLGIADFILIVFWIFYCFCCCNPFCCCRGGKGCCRKFSFMICIE